MDDWMDWWMLREKVAQSIAVTDARETVGYELALKYCNYNA